MAMFALTMVGLIGGETAGERWIHPLCRPLPATKNGPFVALPDGSLLTIDSQGLRSSKDEGKTWSEARPIDPGVNLGYVGHVGQFLRTREGALVLLYLDMANYKWGWDDAKGVPHDDARLELWAIRSLDGGQTWGDKQRLLGGYNADFTGFIQTRSGRLVATVEHLAADPARWVVCSFFSDDEGKSWRRSNWIDLGGHGHHDGATEPGVVELKDGRLMMIIRTGLDRFWQAFSEDDGRYWRRLEPMALDASSAPPFLLRLQSGRLALAWNRLHPEGQPDYPRAAAPSPASEVPASWHREELSLAFSEDEGKSWTKPVVIAREKGAQLAYPYLFERRPGELWVFTRYTYDKDGKPAPPVSVRLNEEEFLRGRVE
ncbi:MAG: exo-alpha-sialidase [Armatimonadetes bacterium]|nr:exo-alpha-sialidase [Armatimonadota bacterium]